MSAVAVDPKTRFDYVDVTRFGHRKAVITPVNKRGQVRKARLVVRGPGGRFAPRGRGQLVFTSRGRLWRLPSVRGFRPVGDWTERANPEIQIAVDTEMIKTGNQITAAWR